MLDKHPALDLVRRQVRNQKHVAEILGVDAKDAARRALQFLRRCRWTKHVPEVVKHVLSVRLGVSEGEIAASAREPVSSAVWHQSHCPRQCNSREYREPVHNLAPLFPAKFDPWQVRSQWLPSQVWTVSGLVDVSRTRRRRVPNLRRQYASFRPATTAADAGSQQPAAIILELCPGAQVPFVAGWRSKWERSPPTVPARPVASARSWGRRR